MSTFLLSPFYQLIMSVLRYFKYSGYGFWVHKLYSIHIGVLGPESCDNLNAIPGTWWMFLGWKRKLMFVPFIHQMGSNIQIHKKIKMAIINVQWEPTGIISESVVCWILRKIYDTRKVFRGWNFLVLFGILKQLLQNMSKM